MLASLDPKRSSDPAPRALSPGRSPRRGPPPRRFRLPGPRSVSAGSRRAARRWLPIRPPSPSGERGRAKGWPAWRNRSAEGRRGRVRSGLARPRWLCVLPNGDVLIAESNPPVRPQDGRGIKGWFFNHSRRRRAGPCRARTASPCCATPTGTASRRPAPSSSPVSLRPSAWPSSEHALLAEATPCCASPTRKERRRSRPRGPGRRPAGRADQSPLDEKRHRSADGSKLYVAVGSNSNAVENGIGRAERAAVWEVDAATGRHRVFASGLRNPSASPGSP